MKKLLTIVVFGQSDGGRSDTLYSGVELIYADGNIPAAVKQAKGKYIIVENRTFLFKDVQPFLDALESATQDVIRFNGGSAFKCSLFKGVADKNDCFAFCAFAAFNAKTVAYFEYAPFIFSSVRCDFDSEEKHLIDTCYEFKRIKAKLSKEAYAFVFELILERLLLFYACALISIREGKITADKLLEFDKNLKDEIVLYLALDKRFGGGKLTKIRNKGFKISGLTSKRYKKILKIKDA
ncbi:MAG: hypothetical protein K2H30_04955 [Clostridia bacterium]|nr:hypothetical protein [Clostridia bacterium]